MSRFSSRCLYLPFPHQICTDGKTDRLPCTAAKFSVRSLRKVEKGCFFSEGIREFFFSKSEKPLLKTLQLPKKEVLDRKRGLEQPRNFDYGDVDVHHFDLITCDTLWWFVFCRLKSRAMGLAMTLINIQI